MDSEPRFEDHNKYMLRALQNQGVSPSDLWVYYFGLGGQLDEIDIEAYLYALVPIPELEYLLLREAVHNLLTDRK